MPYIHTSTFTIRHYECDAHGQLRPATLLGYLQEAAFEASAAVGYSARRYSEIGYQWFAYETELDLLHPVRYGDTVQIKTWVVDFRRVRSLRRYEVYCDGIQIAAASTDWVFINMQTQYPSAILPEIVAAYAQGEAVTPSAPRPPFPPFPTAPPSVFTISRRVEARDIDPAQHVNNAVYIYYVAEAERQHLAAQGWTEARFASEGIEIAARRLMIEYKLAAKLDDDLTIATWVYDMDEAGGKRAYLLTRTVDHKLIARIQSTWGWNDTAAGEACPLSAAFLRELMQD